MSNNYLNIISIVLIGFFVDKIQNDFIVLREILPFLFKKMLIILINLQIYFVF